MIGHKHMRAALIAAALAAAVATPGWARDKTPEEITRELSPVPAQKGEAWSPNMSLEVVAPGQPPAPVYTPPPKPPERHSDIIVGFDFGSAVVKPESISQLRQLAVALAQPAFANYKFSIVGYTDAKGSAAQNLRLSALRAVAVFEILTTRFGVPPAKLYLQGMGKGNLRANDPNAAENRRVEIVNLF